MSGGPVGDEGRRASGEAGGASEFRYRIEVAEWDKAPAVLEVPPERRDGEPVPDPSLAPERSASAPPNPSIRRSGRRRPVVVLLLAALGLAGGVTLWNRLAGPDAPPPRPAASRGEFAAVLWSVLVADQAYVAVVMAPEGADPVAVTLPAELSVDLPGGGPRTIEEVAGDQALLVAAAQSAVGRRVHAAVAQDEAVLARTVDRLGGVRVTVEDLVSAGGRLAGPGPVELSGSDVVAYLAASTDLDRAPRWGQVLRGLLSATADGERWAAAVDLKGEAGRVAARVLAGTAGAEVVELPTIPEESGPLLKDVRLFERLADARLGRGGELVRVVVINGVGIPGVALEVAAALAEGGFWVVAAQNAESFDVEETRVLASGQGLLGRAQQARAALGVGNVYVGAQPTGIADVTIVVGKDFAGAEREGA